MGCENRIFWQRSLVSRELNTKKKICFSLVIHRHFSNVRVFFFFFPREGSGEDISLSILFILLLNFMDHMHRFTPIANDLLF